jgi:hypothetical protein
METAQTKSELNDVEKVFIGSVAFVLRETFEGPPIGRLSSYLDKNAGFFESVASISAEQASQQFYGTTIAAQTEHAKFFLDLLCEYIDGNTERANWEASWLIETVSETEWDALRNSVQESYEKTLRCLAAIDDWNELRASLAMGIVAHTAYHLGSIRQIIKTVNEK